MPDERLQDALFRPGRIGPMELANRIVMAPMTTRLSDAEGHATLQSEAYYRARAEGGIGLVTVEMAAPEPAGKHRHFELAISDDRFLPGLTRIVSGIHDAGAKASIQLGHGGGHTRADICGQTPIAPSAIPHHVQEGHTETIIPAEMSADRIAETIAAFADAARRAERAGFDAIELHGAHGYLLSQFMSPLENTRQDNYGGDLRNRARFALEIMAAVRAAVPGLAVIFRMNGDDFFEGGLTASEAVDVARWVADAGADAIHVTGGHYRSQPNAAIMIPPMATAPMPFLGFARAIKAAVNVPVIAVGRLGDPTAAAAAITHGDADFIALGRPLLADPDWANTARAGTTVRRCLACNSCVDGMRDGERLRCIVNPRTGRETDPAFGALTRSGQRIAVIGAGPAGLAYAAEMSCANFVSVFEKCAKAGGALRLAGYAPMFQGVVADAQSLLDYIASQERRCRERGVSFMFEVDVLRDPALLRGFDHVVVATGARYRAGAGPVVEALLRRGTLRRTPFKALMCRAGPRDWFYHKARAATGPAITARLHDLGHSTDTIGDAACAGKTDAAIASAYAAAYQYCVQNNDDG